MTKAFVAATQALQQHCRRFDASGLEAKSAALAQVAAAPLPLSAALIGHHEALLFLRAHPSSAAMLRQVEAELARLTRFLQAHRGQHPEALQNHGLPFVATATRYSHDCLQAVLEANNRNDGAGRLNDGEEALLVRAEGAIKTVDDVKAIVLQAKDGNIVRIADVATVGLGALTRYGAVTKSGKGEAVEGLVLGLRGANAQSVVDGVKARLAEIAPSLPPGITIEPFYDRSNLVQRAVGTVSKALLEAIVLVVLLLLAFLGNLRAALVVALMLPLSALATFILMRTAGLSANLMSLGGLAIAIGMLVDAAVVVVENVESQLAEAQENLPTLHLIFRAAREVASPVTSGIVIIIIVFLPLLTLQGLEGKMFGPVALTIVFALASSLLLSLTVVPVLASYLIQRGVHHEPWLVKKLSAIYNRMLGSALSHSRTYVLGATIALAAAAGAFMLLGKSFMPTMDEGDLIMQLEKLPSIGIDQTIAIDSAVQRAILAQVPEVKAIVARAGSDELGLDPMGLNQTDTFMVLNPRETWRKPDPAWLADQLRAVMVDFPGIGFSFTQPIDMRVSEMLTGVRGDLAIKIFWPRPCHAEQAGGRGRKYSQKGKRRRRHLHAEKRRRAISENRR